MSKNVMGEAELDGYWRLRAELRALVEKFEHEARRPPKDDWDYGNVCAYAHAARLLEALREEWER